MKIVVAGSRGMLAQDLIPLIRKNHETLSFDENQLDISDEKCTLDLVMDVKPGLVINCAAYNRVDQAETDRDEAFRVNAYGVKNLAVACRESGAVLCHFSTDYVFDGKTTQPYEPSDHPNPINVYGESKRAGEVFLQSILPQHHYLVRTSSLYGSHGSNFVSTILRLAQENQVLRVVDDQIMSPTWTINLAQGVARLIESRQFGTYHLTDDTKGGITWFAFAQKILEMKGLDNELRPITSETFKRPAKRPAYSVLDIALFTRRTGYKPITWQESLRRFLEII